MDFQNLCYIESCDWWLGIPCGQSIWTLPDCSWDKGSNKKLNDYPAHFDTTIYPIYHMTNEVVVVRLLKSLIKWFQLFSKQYIFLHITTAYLVQFLLQSQRVYTETDLSLYAVQETCKFPCYEGCPCIDPDCDL